LTVMTPMAPRFVKSITSDILRFSRFRANPKVRQHIALILTCRFIARNRRPGSGESERYCHGSILPAAKLIQPNNLANRGSGQSRGRDQRRQKNSTEFDYAENSTRCGISVSALTVPAAKSATISAAGRRSPSMPAPCPAAFIYRSQRPASIAALKKSSIRTRW